MPQRRLDVASPAERPETAVLASDPLCDRADTLYRAADECCRQRCRYAQKVRAAVADGEQRASEKVATHCGEFLGRAAAAYERAAARAAGREDQQWWHRANMLWHAAREYLRHRELAARLCRGLDGDHPPLRLAEIAVQYDLEASALLALRQAVEEYRRVRPEADLQTADAAAGVPAAS